MRISFINVGYGDSILFQTEDGHTLLLDGGGNLPQEFANDQFRIRSIDYLQKKGITHLDGVIISHIHEDHVCGLAPILKQIPADAFYVPYPIEPFLDGREIVPDMNAPRSVPLYASALNDYRCIICDAVSRNTPVHVLHAGDKIHVFSNVVMDVLAPVTERVLDYVSLIKEAYDPSQSSVTMTAALTKLDATSNATSLLLRMEVEEVVFLLAADCCPREWTHVPSFLLENVNVLKLPHHGQKDAVDEKMMGKMALSHVITTASSDRRYGSANDEVYRRLTELCGAMTPQFLFTDEREYLPYFLQTDGFHAVSLTVRSGKICVEFDGFDSIDFN